MKEVYLEKIVLNIQVDKAETEQLKKVHTFFSKIMGRARKETYAKKNIKNFNIRPNKLLGYKVTYRKKEATELLKKLLISKDNKLRAYQFSIKGGLNFSLKTYVDIRGTSYDVSIGQMGVHVNISFAKKGIRNKNRREKTSTIGKKQIRTRKEEINFMRKVIRELEILL